MLFGQVLQGVLLGAYYGLIASGLSFLFGVMRIINLAHGSLMVLAAYLILVLITKAGISPILALLLALPIMAILGLGLQRFVLDRSLRAGPLVPLLSTFGLSVLLDNVMFEHFGADTQSIAPSLGDLSYASFDITDRLSIAQLDILNLVVAVALLGGVQFFLSRSTLGRAIRATAEDPDVVGLIGIDQRRIYALATAIAMAMITIAGMALGVRATFAPYSGGAQLIFAFEAVVIGGFGSLWGTLVGGIVLGVAQNLGAYIRPQYFLIAGHAAFLVILVGRLALAGRRLPRLWPRRKALAAPPGAAA